MFLEFIFIFVAVDLNVKFWLSIKLINSLQKMKKLTVY